MTTANEDIQSALHKQLVQLTPSLPIAWENKEYSPTAGTPYLRSWLLPGQTTTVSLGPDGYNLYVGVYQIDCLYPINKGWYPAKVKAGAICTLFKRGTLITYNSICVRVMKCYPSSGDIDGDFHKVSVSVEYECYDNS
jgi:hypothetical protein